MSELVATWEATWAVRGGPAELLHTVFLAITDHHQERAGGTDTRAGHYFKDLAEIESCTAHWWRIDGQLAGTDFWQFDRQVEQYMDPEMAHVRSDYREKASAGGG